MAAHLDDILALKVLGLRVSKRLGEKARIPSPDFALLEQTSDVLLWRNDTIA